MPTLKARIRGGESATTEFKSRPTTPEKLARILCAFANSAGGDLIVGVDDRGGVVGVEDREAARAMIEEAAAFVDERPRIAIETLVHELMDVIVVRVELNPFPELSAVDLLGDRTTYFRIGSETRPIDRPTEKMLIRLHRHYGGDRRLEPDAERLVKWLWEQPEAIEPRCARKLNYGKHRLRKLAERTIGQGYLIPTHIGEGRSYAAIHPA